MEGSSPPWTHTRHSNLDQNHSKIKGSGWKEKVKDSKWSKFAREDFDHLWGGFSLELNIINAKINCKKRVDESSLLF